MCCLYPPVYTRAYISFKNQDIILFRDRFDGAVFLDNKGESLKLKSLSFVCFNTALVFHSFLNTFFSKILGDRMCNIFKEFLHIW